MEFNILFSFWRKLLITGANRKKIIIPIVGAVVHPEISFHITVRTVDKISKQITEDHFWTNILISFRKPLIFCNQMELHRITSFIQRQQMVANAICCSGGKVYSKYHGPVPDTSTLGEQDHSDMECEGSLFLQENQKAAHPFSHKVTAFKKVSALNISLQHILCMHGYHFPFPHTGCHQLHFIFFSTERTLQMTVGTSKFRVGRRTHKSWLRLSYNTAPAMQNWDS